MTIHEVESDRGEVRTRRNARAILGSILALTFGVANQASAIWTSWVSEEFGQAKCASGTAAYQVHCNGSYCDQVRMNCKTMPGGLNADDWHETDWVEHGGDIFGGGAIKETQCQDGYWATELQCMGDWCDNVRLICTKGTRSHGACEWTTTWWSEEQGTYPGKAGYLLAGVRCSGPHCDNKQYYICSPRSPGGSCGGTACNWSSPDGSCFCDSECVNYGDCCPDRNVFCE
jgi:hypothetical protein